MTDYGEQGATPVDDAAVDDPPTVDEVMEAQRREHPEQAATSTMAMPATRPGIRAADGARRSDAATGDDATSEGPAPQAP